MHKFNMLYIPFQFQPNFAWFDSILEFRPSLKRSDSQVYAGTKNNKIYQLQGNLQSNLVSIQYIFDPFWKFFFVSCMWTITTDKLSMISLHMWCMLNSSIVLLSKLSKYFYRPNMTYMMLFSLYSHGYSFKIS